MKSIINLDWLSINYTLAVEKQDKPDEFILKEWSEKFEGYEFEHLSGTKVFKNRTIISRNGIKKLTWLYNPKSSIINPAMSIIEFANNSLYSDEWIDLYDIIDYAHIGVLSGISRLDICCDFQKFINYNGLELDCKFLMQDLTKMNVYIQGKRECCEFNDFFTDFNNSIEKQPRQISFGSKTSKIKWKIYNKTKELNEIHAKDYIKAIWQRNGFDLEKDTYRCEVSVNNITSLSISKDNFDLLHLNSLMKNKEILFNGLYNKFFVMRANERNLNKNRNKRIDFLKLGDFGVKILKKEAINQMIENSPKTFLNQLLKAYNNNIITKNSLMIDTVFKCICDTVKEFNLYEYYDKVCGISLDALYFAGIEKTSIKNFISILYI